MKLEYIEAGEIVTTHGVRGEVKVLCWLDAPEMLCDIPNLSVSIFGIIVSYACQKVHIRKNANPTKIVFL